MKNNNNNNPIKDGKNGGEESEQGSHDCEDDGDVRHEQEEEEEEEEEEEREILIPGLPNDVGIQCLARLPRSHHSSLSLVSKSFHSLLHSSLFFSTRSQLNSTQHFLLFLLRTSSQPKSQSPFSWFFLDPTSSSIVKQAIRLPPTPTAAVGAAVATSGTNLYVFGGAVNEIPTNSVWVFDGILNRWSPGPPMSVCREFSAAGEIDGKIYVLGGCQTDSFARSNAWAEVFDPKIGSWSAVCSPVEIREKWMHGNAVLGGRLLAMADRGGVAFDPRNSTWMPASGVLDSGWRGRAAVVDGILYCYDFLGKIRGYDPEEDRWKKLKGVKKRLPKFLCGAAMANVGGKLFVVWERRESSTAADWRGKGCELLCAEIEVLKQQDGNLQGVILWMQGILPMPRDAWIVNCLSMGF